MAKFSPEINGLSGSAETNRPLSYPELKPVEVIFERVCIGFVVRQFDGFMAFGAGEESIGLFVTENDALAAIFTRGGSAS